MTAMLIGIVLYGLSAAEPRLPVRPDIPQDRQPSTYIVVPAEPTWFGLAKPICDWPAWLSRAPQCLRKPTYRSRQ